MGSLNEEMRRQRKVRGLTQLAVAKDLGLSGRVVHNWESRATTINGKMAKAYVDLYDGDAVDLLVALLEDEEARQ